MCTLNLIKSAYFNLISIKEEQFLIKLFFSPLNNINHSCVIRLILMFYSYKLDYKIFADIYYVKSYDDQALTLDKRLPI